MSTIGHISARDTAGRELTALPAVLRRTVWGAVFAGALAAIGLQIIFTVLGIAIGISAADPSDTARGAGMAAGLWWLITGTISLCAGGMVLGRMGGIPRSIDIVLHAFAMWAVTAVFGFLMIWNGADAAARTGAGLAGAVGPQHLLGPRAAYALPAADNREQDSPSTTDRSSDIREGMANPNLDPRDTRGPALSAADVEAARKAAQMASWWTLGGLMLGVAAACFGGWFAAPERIIVRAPFEGAAP